MQTKLSQLAATASKMMGTKKGSKEIYPLLSNSEVKALENLTEKLYTPGQPVEDLLHPVVKNKIEKLNRRKQN